MSNYGYWLVQCMGHPFAWKRSEYVFEHRLVAEKYGCVDISEKTIEHERCWAVYATIRHALAWHDHPEGGMTVDFDEPMGYGERMPVCRVEDV